MFILWAKGQEQGNYKHFQSSSIEAGKGDKNFYRMDEVKYHGSTGQRGTASLNFFGKLDDSKCE